MYTYGMSVQTTDTLGKVSIYKHKYKYNIMIKQNSNY